jgi:molecular chaperone DnaK (HSP70)
MDQRKVGKVSKPFFPLAFRDTLPMLTCFAVIGIDLGATYSRIGISQGGKFQIIPDKQGRIETPSWVLFTNDGTIFGEEAKLLAKHNPKNTVYNAR